MVQEFEAKVDLAHYQKRKLAEVVLVQDRRPIKFGETTITPVNFNRPDRVRYGFLIKDESSRIMYAPCSIYGAEYDSFWKDLDVLIMETGWHGNTKRMREKKVEECFEDHISLEECFELHRQLRPKRTILTHLHGGLHQTYDFLCDAASKHPGVEVGYDGMDVI